MLTAIRLKNCQSWDDITLNIATDTLNVIVADNGVGKSVLFKMLKLTANPNAYSKEERRDIIRYGEDCAQIVFAFDDGSVGCTFVYSTRVVYYYKRSNASSFESFNSPPQELLDAIGLITNSTSKFVANILDTDQDLFLVESDSAGNIELLQKLADHPVLKEVLLKVNDEIDILTAKKHTVDIQMDTLERSLQDYTYVDTDKLEVVINLAESEVCLLQELQNYKLSLEKIASALIDTTDYYNVLQQFDILQQLVVLRDNMHKLSFDSKDYAFILSKISVILELCTISDRIKVKIPESIDFSQKIQLLDCLLELIEQLSKIQENNTIVVSCKEDIDILQKDISYIKGEIDSSGLVMNCPVKGKVIYTDEKCIPYS